MDPIASLASALGMEHHHPILSMLRGHGCHIERERERERVRVREILQDTTKIMYGVNIPRKNLQKTSKIVVQDPRPYIMELMQKVQKSVFFR